MDYVKIYEEFISKYKKREVYPLRGKGHLHHITPKSYGGEDTTANLVKLTPREHLFAHLILAKIHPSDIGMLGAANLLRGYYTSRILKETRFPHLWVRNKVADNKFKDTKEYKNHIQIRNKRIKETAYRNTINLYGECPGELEDYRMLTKYGWVLIKSVVLRKYGPPPFDDYYNFIVVDGHYVQKKEIANWVTLHKSYQIAHLEKSYGKCPFPYVKAYYNKSKAEWKEAPSFTKILPNGTRDF
jgi:hypothetical protein